eukprot:scaffold40430_cov26-Prasinocladus_malaysianus.AAC.2
MANMDEVLEQHGGATLATYLSVLSNPALQGKTHVGDLRRNPRESMGARVINMTEEVSHHISLGCRMLRRWFGGEQIHFEC